MAVRARRSWGTAPAPLSFGLCLALQFVAGCGARTTLRTEAAPETGSPDAATCTDSTRPCSEVVLFGGGLKFNRPSDETWIWNGASWRQDHVRGPSARVNAAMATLGTTVVLFGGLGLLYEGDDDTWTFDGTSWTQRHVAGPSARTGHAMATLNGTVVLFGGQDHVDGSFLGDTWTWNGGAWTKRGVLGPVTRMGASMATLNNSVVLFGGFHDRQPLPSTSLGDTWIWDGTSWTEVAVRGPSPRTGAAMATLNGKVVLFGGEDDTNSLVDDTWTWDGTRWTAEDVLAPDRRLFGSMAELDGKVVLFGGVLPTLAQGGTWTWDGESWMQRDVTGPATRTGAPMATLNRP
jgi:Kelch motif